MPTNLPPDEVLLEEAIVNALQTTILSVVGNGPQQIPSNQMPVIQTRQRFAETDEEDVAVSTIPDPITPDIPRLAIIEIGIPTVDEIPYAGTDSNTQLNFTYPIGLEIEVVDLWNDPNNILRYKNSTALTKALYMRIRRAFKKNINLGFENCVRKYLQQVSAITAIDEETGGKRHLIDWSITVQATGILV